MKRFNKMMVFFLFMLAGFSRDISAWGFTFVNMTGTDVKIQLLHSFGTIEKTRVITPFESYKFSSNGWCLARLKGSHFDEEKNKWQPLRALIPVPIKLVNRELFNATKNAIGELGQAITQVGRLAAIAGPKGILAAGAIAGLASTARAGASLYEISFCRSREFMLILDQMVLPDGRPASIKKLREGVIVEEPILIPYALTPPE